MHLLFLAKRIFQMHESRKITFHHPDDTRKRQHKLNQGPQIPPRPARSPPRWYRSFAFDRPSSLLPKQLNQKFSLVHPNLPIRVPQSQSPVTSACLEKKFFLPSPPLYFAHLRLSLFAHLSSFSLACFPFFSSSRTVLPPYIKVEKFPKIATTIY